MSPTIQTLFAPCIPSFGVVTLSLSFLLLLLLGVSHKKRNGNEQVFLRKQEIPKKRPTSGTSDEQFVKVFPHQTRENLKLLAATLPELQRVRLGNLKFDQSVFEQSILDFVENPLDADPGKYVYSGYSVREVKALGDFPDYAILSGIPLPNPWTEFDIEKSRPRPYRPLRWPYHQTLALTKMQPDFWLDLDGNYKHDIARRKGFFADHEKDTVASLPGSELALKELLEMVIQFLCARFPQYFTLSEDKRVFENKILGISERIRERHPFKVLLDHIPEDFAVMLRNPRTGRYHLRAALMFSTLGYNVAGKIGKDLPSLHKPVPDYKEKMELSMDRIFTSNRTDKLIQRGSWGLEYGEPYYMPLGDPHERHRDYQLEIMREEDITFRVDWQRLRRLPLSGALVFVNRAVFTRLPKFRSEPYIPSLCLRILDQGKENIMKYKNSWHVEHVAKPALRRYIREQEEKGLIEKHWDPITLPESPYFPGALEEWHSDQGF